VNALRESQKQSQFVDSELARIPDLIQIFGRDLQLEYAERTLVHIRALWGREVALETVLGGKKAVLRLVNDSLKVEKI
jgi:spore cortex formation protein SpoVR/YcgB (stage V sporulation)